MASGGARVGAGRKVAWLAGPADSGIRVPKVIASDLMLVCRRVDELLHLGFNVSEILSHLNHIKKN
jgi:hypothetical protein